MPLYRKEAALVVRAVTRREAEEKLGDLLDWLNADADEESGYVRLGDGDAELVHGRRRREARGALGPRRLSDDA